MARFLTVFEVEPAIRLPETYVYPPDQDSDVGARLEVRPIVKSAANTRSFQSGLELRCEVDAETAEEAVRKGRAFVEGMLSVFSFVSGVGLPPAHASRAFDVSPQKEQREFVQYFDTPHSQVSRRTLDLASLGRVLESLGAVKDNGKAKRLARAVRWHRLAAGEPDPLDRFSYRWIGLEALNPVLMKELGAPKSTHTCAKCGHEWELSDSGGIKGLCMRDFEDGDELFKRIRDFRVALQHGVGDIERMYEEGGARANEARGVLAAAILTLLGLDDMREAVLQREITNAIPTKVSIHGALSGADPDRLGPPEMNPHLILEGITETVEVGDEGEEKVTVSGKFTAKLGEGVRIAVSEFRVQSEADRVEIGPIRKL